MNIKKLLVLNLPNREQITRRYMCSYVSPESLMPPLELISCAAVGRSWHNLDVRLLDAIAERKDTADTIRFIKEFAPDVIVSITGFECYEEDVDVFREVKEAFPAATFVYFGHYATHFSEATLIHSKADYIILGEPELVLNDLLTGLQTNNTDAVQGIAYLRNNKIVTQGTAGRIRDPNQLPPPAYDLLPRNENYYEPLMAKPYGMIQTMRGCPYLCNYCVKSYGSKVAQLKPERIVAEMRTWVDLHAVKAIRFIDDTFTVNRHRTIELCKAIIDGNLSHIEWACLSRTDNLDEEVLTWMKKAGCKRIYFGMESGSQRMLDIYQKNVKTEDAMEALKQCRKAGIETAAFFMAGHPDELESDFTETLEFAKSANLNYASFNPLTPYPGTPLYNQIKHLIDFNIYPYKNEWKNQAIYDKFDMDKKRFYRGFYMRPLYFAGNLKIFIRNSKQILQLGFDMLRYLFWDKQFVISGLKGAKDK